MNQGHEEIQEMLPAAALEILEHAELQRLVIHIGDCTECAGLLREYRDAAASLALLVPAGELSPERAATLRNRLMARVQADRGRRRPRDLRVDRWMGWAVAAGLAGVLLVHHSVHQTLDYGWFAAGLLAFVLAGVALYARKQRRRVEELEER